MLCCHYMAPNHTRQATGTCCKYSTCAFWHWAGGPWSLVKSGIQAIIACQSNGYKEALLEQAQGIRMSPSAKPTIRESIPCQRWQRKGTAAETLSEDDLNRLTQDYNLWK